MMKQLLVSIPASITLYVEVEDDASEEAIKEAVVEQYDNEHGKYVELRAGVHFDPEEFNILDEAKL